MRLGAKPKSMPKKQVKKPPEPASGRSAPMTIESAPNAESIAIDDTEWQGDTSYTTAEAAKPAGPVDMPAVTAAPSSSTTTQQLTQEEIDSVVLQLNGWQAEAMKRTQKSMGNSSWFKLASQEEEAPNRRKVFQLNGWQAEAMKRPRKQVKKPPEPTQQLTIREICEQSAMGHEEIDSVVLQLNGWQAEAMKRTQKSMGNSSWLPMDFCVLFMASACQPFNCKTTESISS